MTITFEVAIIYQLQLHWQQNDNYNYSEENRTIEATVEETANYDNRSNTLAILVIVTQLYCYIENSQSNNVCFQFCFLNF